MDERIRARVRDEMTRRGMSQKALAKQLGISPPALSQIMSGKRGTMPESLLDVLEALGLTLDAVPLADVSEPVAPVPRRGEEHAEKESPAPAPAPGQGGGK